MNKRFLFCFINLVLGTSLINAFHSTQTALRNSTSVINTMFKEEIVGFVHGCILFILFSDCRSLRSSEFSSMLTSLIHDEREMISRRDAIWFYEDYIQKTFLLIFLLKWNFKKNKWFEIYFQKSFTWVFWSFCLLGNF